jgi:hypothetical protein
MSYRNDRKPAMEEYMSTKVKIGAIVGGILLVLFGLFVVFVGIPEAKERAATRERFAPFMEEFTNSSQFHESDGEAYIIGKIAVINKTESDLDDTHFSYKLDELRAASPEDVGTIVWLECKEQLRGTYDSGSKGYRWACDVTTIDKGEGVIVGQEKIYGDDPPDSKRSRGDWHGSRPTDNIIAYIAELPTN